MFFSSAFVLTMDNLGRFRPTGSSPPIGSPTNFAEFLDGGQGGVAQSLRSNQFRPPSPVVRPQQQSRNSDDPPLLKRSKVDYTPDEPITNLVSGRSQIAIATKDKKISVIDTSTSEQTSCDISRYLGSRLLQARIHKLFMDPTGKFILISLAYAADNQPMENLLYVKQVQPLPRLKNYLISAVAWNHPKTNSSSNTSNSTGTILLGTTKGLVLQTELMPNDESKFFPLASGPRQYVKEVFDVGSDVGAITGIEYHQIPSTTQTEKAFIIIISTNSRLYRMLGSVPANVDPPPLHTIFAQNINSYKDVPGRFTNSKLDLYYPSPTAPPTRFAWLTEPGVLTSDIHNQFNQCRTSFESNEDINIISYITPRETINDIPLSTSTPSGLSPPSGYMNAYFYDKPVSMIVTNFHILIAFRHCLKAICILNDLTVYEEYFSTKYGHIQGISKDPIKNIIWVYCERAVYRYKILNENKNIWKIYLDQRRFDLARKYSSSDENNYDRVICEEAQHYFKQKDYEKSAEIFARSKRPFEDVSLMFMEAKSSKALKKYLTIRLDQFDSNQMTQITMTLAWLLDLIMSSISVISLQSTTDATVEETQELYSELDSLLENEQIIRCLREHSTLFYGVIMNYMDWNTCIRVAKLIGDSDFVVQRYIDLGKLDDALEMIKSDPKDEFYYTYGHLFMKRKPKEFIDTLIERPNIDPERLIPILIQENPYFNKCSETIRYLEHCIKNLRTDSKVIHNYLFELYARHKDENTLIEYLDNELSPDNVQQPHLDLQLCLRLCTELKLIKACVSLYSYMGMYDEALSLTLNVDLELAKSVARKPDCEDEQKKMWLIIAEHVLTMNKDIQIATDLLRESKLLRIEDILPFFPDSKTIDYFRDAIRKSLQDYRNQIMLLKDGTFDNIAEDIRSEIKTFRNRYSIIRVEQKCEICSQNLLLRTCYVFPCGHLFHSDCMIKEIIAIDPQYKGLEDKLKQIATDETRQQIEDVISSECVYCGSLLANIDKPAPLSSRFLANETNSSAGKYLSVPSLINSSASQAQQMPD